MAEEAGVPWCDAKIAFTVRKGAATWAARDQGRLPLPGGWELVETDSSAARYVAIFRVKGPIRPEDGRAVRAALDAI